MLHGGITTTLDSQTVDEHLLNDHISFEVATSLLNEIVFDTDMNDDEVTISI
jgi:hypothetical protein